MAWLLSQALMNRYGSLPCSQEQAEEFSAGCCSVGAQSAPSNATPTQRAYLWRDKTTEFWNRFPSGMTCELLTAERGEAVLTSCLADFPVRTSAQPEKGLESTESNPACGEKWPASLAKYDHASRSWKTRQFSLAGDLIEFSGTWPEWGMTRDGELYPQPPLVRRTSESVSGLSPGIMVLAMSGGIDDEPFIGRVMEHSRNEVRVVSSSGAIACLPQGSVHSIPTPQASDWKSGSGYFHGAKKQTPQLRHLVGGAICPNVCEWLMWWPVEWSALWPLETARFHAWRLSHGES